MSVGIETFELSSRVVTFFAKEKVITILTHPTMFEDLNLTSKAFIYFILLDLRFKYHFQLVRWLVPFIRVVV